MIPERQVRQSDKNTETPAPTGPPKAPAPRSVLPTPVRLSWLGLPRFQWSVTLFGLCLFTASIVTYRLPLGDVGIAIALVGLALQPQRLRLPLPVYLFGAFVLWAFIASFLSPFPEIARDKVIDHLKLLAIMIVVVNALRTEGQLRFYLLFFLGCFILFPGRGTLQGGDTKGGRAVWNYIYSNSNDLATLSLLALGVAFAFLFAKPSPAFVRFGGALSAIVLLVIILLTQSRGAFIGLVVGMGPAFARLGLKRPSLLVVAVIVGIAIGYSVPVSVWERLAGIEKLTSKSTIADADPEGSAEQRFEIQKVGWQIFLDHPVFGVGLGVYPRANAMYAPDIGRRDTHNTYLNLAAEVGLPGLVLWGACFGSVFRFAYRARRLAAPCALATQQAWLERAFIAYLVASVVGTYAKLTFPYLMLAVLWCSASLLAAQSRPTSTSTRTERL